MPSDCSVMRHFLISCIVIIKRQINLFLLFFLVECPIGKYYDAADKKCKMCSNGTFQDVEGQFGCKKCQPGFYTLGSDEKNFTSCKGNKNR